MSNSGGLSIKNGSGEELSYSSLISNFIRLHQAKPFKIGYWLEILPFRDLNNLSRIVESFIEVKTTLPVSQIDQDDVFLVSITALSAELQSQELTEDQIIQGVLSLSPLISTERLKRQGRLKIRETMSLTGPFKIELIGPIEAPSLH